MGGGDDMFSMGSSMSGGSGGMGGDMMGMGGSGSGLPSLTTIGGLIIQAHTITPYGANFGRDPQLAPEPKYPFEVPEKEEEPTEEVVVDEMGNETTVQKDESHLDQSGELLFVRNLKKSKLFSNEEGFTDIVTSSKNPYLENGVDFEVQVKFNVVLEAYPWSEAKTTSGGMGSSMRGSGY